MDNVYNFVAFRAEILCCGQPYDRALFETDFLATYNRFGSKEAQKYILGLATQHNDNKLDVLQEEVSRGKDRKCKILLERLRDGSNAGPKSEYSSITKNIIHKSYHKHALTPIEGLALLMGQIQALRKCYYTCIDTIKFKYPRSSFFPILYFTSEYYRTQLHALAEYYRFLSPTLPEIIEADRLNKENGHRTISQYYTRCIQIEKEDITHERQTTYREHHNSRKTGYQMSKVFNAFVENKRSKYANHGLTFSRYNKSGRQQNTSDSNITIHFWENASIQDRLRFDFIDFCSDKDLTDAEKKIIAEQDSVALANIILDELDEDLMQELQLSSPVISTKNGSLCWDAKYLKTAEYLCLFRDLMSQKEYRVCPICKAVFFVEGRGKTRKHCKNHTADQIDYYNRCLRAAARKESENKQPSQ